jgi:hypothetical protein
VARKATPPKVGKKGLGLLIMIGGLPKSPRKIGRRQKPDSKKKD